MIDLRLLQLFEHRGGDGAAVGDLNGFQDFYSPGGTAVKESIY